MKYTMHYDNIYVVIIMYNLNDKVRIKGTKIYGKIDGISNKNAVLKTEDFKKIIIPKEEIEKFDYTESKKNVSINFKINQKQITDEIMLRHLTKEEAINKLDIFISSCLVNKVYKVKIIHGKNGGILRNAVHEYLKKSEFVSSFELAGYFEGQYGVTIAYLKNRI